MILRRVMEHVRTQNWVAVALDFVIVVVGVFVGIQLGNWNDRRMEEARQEQILHRLFDESVEAVRYFEEMVESFERLNTRRLAAARGLREGTWRDLDPGALTHGIAAAGYFPSPAPKRSALNELLDSGLFATLEAQEVRVAVDDYTTALSFLEGQTDYFRQFRVRAIDFEGVERTIDLDRPRQTGLQMDFEVLAQQPKLVNEMLQTHNAAIAITGWWRSAWLNAYDLCLTVAEHLDETCTAKPPLNDEGEPL